MINKIKKSIHNKFSNIFKFFFFLRYIFLIFLSAIVIFLTIPKFFDYNKNIDVLKSNLTNLYGLETKNYEEITYNFFPSPRLSLKNVSLNIVDSPTNFKTNNLDIILNIKSIYKFENLKLEKIIFSNSVIDLDIDESKSFLNYIKDLKKKIQFKSLKIELKKQKEIILSLKQINFLNFGYKKFKVSGNIFGKKFRLSFNRDNQDLLFKILNTGIEAKFTFDKKSSINNLSGSSEVNISNNYLKFIFSQNEDVLKINKANFRNKYLQFSFNSLIKFKPYFDINSKIKVNKIDKKIIDKFEIENIFKHQDKIKKFNSNNSIIYQKKKYRRGIIKDISINLDLENGKMIYSKIINISGGKLKCFGESKLTEEYPRLFFNCDLSLDNKKILFKKLEILKDKNDDDFKINIVGSINILNKKIIFEKIKIKNIYSAQTEDLEYFQQTFERILFDDSFLNIFKLDKIKSFFQEVI